LRKAKIYNRVNSVGFMIDEKGESFIVIYNAAYKMWCVMKPINEVVSSFNIPNPCPL